MFALWIMIKPLIIALSPGLGSAWRGVRVVLGDVLPTLVAIAAMIGVAALLFTWTTAPARPPMVLISEVENRDRAAHVKALLAANQQLEGTLQDRDEREGALRTRIGELEKQQRKAREHDTEETGSSDLFSDNSQWMQSKRRRARSR